jgi:hypothetical protein
MRSNRKLTHHPSGAGATPSHLSIASRAHSATPVTNHQLQVTDHQVLNEDCHLMEYPRASIHAENARLNASIPCWYVAFAWPSYCCFCWALACAASCLDALFAFLCFAPLTIVPAAAPAPAPLPASSSAIAPIAAPPAAPLAAPLTRPPFTCLALSAAACCSAFFCSSVLVPGGGAWGVNSRLLFG